VYGFEDRLEAMLREVGPIAVAVQPRFYYIIDQTPFIRGQTREEWIDEQIDKGIAEILGEADDG